MLALLLPAAFAVAQDAYEAGDLPRAEQQLAVALREDPDCAWCHYLAANIAARHGDASTELWELERTVALDPQTSAHHDLGNLALRRGDEKSALREFRADLKTHADCYEARINVAALLLKSGHPADAASEYAISLRYHPQDPRAEQGLRRAQLHQTLPFAAMFALCCAIFFLHRRHVRS
jgi:predicted Zn-dependent protease